MSPNFTITILCCAGLYILLTALTEVDMLAAKMLFFGGILLFFAVVVLCYKALDVMWRYINTKPGPKQ